LGEDCSSSKIQTIGLNVEGLQVLERHKDWGTSDCHLRYFKGSMFLIVPGPGYVRLCKVEQRLDQYREVTDKLVVEVNEPQEGLYAIS